MGFDTSSEPGDEDYPGEAIDSKPVVPDDGQVAIEDPKRPGYVFEGWVIPSADGTEAVDQDLVYQDDDGKWYVDASKLPGYAGDDGRVELTARWTAALSVDAPISATFMYDLSQWDGAEARDAYVEGSSTVKNRSAVPIRVSGIESSRGGSAGVLKRADGTALDDAAAASGAKVLSVFPTTSEATGTEGDAKAPASDDAADDMAHKVDLSLDDVLLERSFDADAWAVDAATVGDNGVTVSTGDLKLGYRLNLGGSTGVTLDQDALLAVTGEPEGAGPSEAAPIANLAYCFAAEGLLPTGTKADPLWVEVTDPKVGSVGVYGLADIKRAADDFSARVDPSTDPNDQAAIYAQLEGSPYFRLFRELFEGKAPFKAQLADGRYLDMNIIGIGQDVRASDKRRAGLTLQSVGCERLSAMNPTSYESGIQGWALPQPLRTLLNANFFASSVASSIVPVEKYHQVGGWSGAGSHLGPMSVESVFLPSAYEVFGEPVDSFRNGDEVGIPASHKFRYAFFDSQESRVKRLEGVARYWWLRSAIKMSAGGFDLVAPSGTIADNYSDLLYGVAPAFCL